MYDPLLETLWGGWDGPASSLLPGAGRTLGSPSGCPELIGSTSTLSRLSAALQSKAQAPHSPPVGPGAAGGGWRPRFLLLGKVGPPRRVRQAVAPRTVPDCGTPQLQRARASGHGGPHSRRKSWGWAVRGFPGARPPSGASESRARKDLPTRLCWRLSGDRRPWPDTPIWKPGTAGASLLPCWFCPLVVAAREVPRGGAAWLLPLS